MTIQIPLLYLAAVLCLVNLAVLKKMKRGRFRRNMEYFMLALLGVSLHMFVVALCRM